jgi:hypothetical protein
MKKIIKFNNIDDLFVISKFVDPITGFYEYLIASDDNYTLNFLAGHTLDVSSVVLNDKQYNTEVRERILLKYSKKRDNYSSDRQRKLSVSMLDFDIGPRTSDEVPAGEVWLYDGWLKKG